MVENLIKKLEEASASYYNSESITMSNDTYDALVETLRRLAPEHPYLKKVGTPVSSEKKVGRVVPMGTLRKYHKDEDVLEWIRSESDDFLCCPKYDGFGVELIYQDGFLKMASTRGDGHVGEDVLEAILRIQSIPMKLPAEWDALTRVRGEAIIPTIYHQNIKDLGYSAMRNAVPGIVRSNRKDALAYVDFVAYEFFDGTNDRIKQRETYKSLFHVESYEVFNPTQFDSLKAFREDFGDKKQQFSYEVDGIVLKTARIKEDELLCPSHQIAWKWKSNREETILREIKFEVGATGAISVVGIFDEVEFQGAKLKRASFGSLALYREMRPAIGDMIEVSRRGDIIPWIEGISVRNSENYLDLEECPCCGTPLVADRCTNKKCPDRVKLKLYQYVKGVGVKGIGYSLLVALVDNGIIEKLPDIYEMDCKEICRLPRQGQSSAEKWSELQNKSLSPLEFLCAYPFENIGQSLWSKILSYYEFKDVPTLTRESLLSANLKGIGSSKIESIASQIEDSKEELIQLIEILNLK